MVNSLKIAFVYGALIAAGVSTWVLVMFSLGFYGNPDSAMNYVDALSIIIPILGLTFGIRSYKKQNHSGLKFKEGFLTGLNISVVAGLLSALFFLIYYEMIDPASLDLVAKNYAGVVEKEKVMKFEVFSQFLSTVVMGIIITTVVALALKSKKSV